MRRDNGYQWYPVYTSNQFSSILKSLRLRRRGNKTGVEFGVLDMWVEQKEIKTYV
jgi:hypothetical protein